jgi:hypothetical protein
MIDKNLINEVAASYKKLMVVAEEAKHPGIVMEAIDELRANLTTLSMETDPDPRAVIRRAGGYEAWMKARAAQEDVVNIPGGGAAWEKAIEGNMKEAV